MEPKAAAAFQTLPAFLIIKNFTGRLKFLWFEGIWATKFSMWAKRLEEYYWDGWTRNGSVSDEPVKLGLASLFDILAEALANKDGTFGSMATRHRIQLAHTKSGTVWYAPDLHETLERAIYPPALHRFRSIVARNSSACADAVVWAGAFHWNCHTLESFTRSPSQPTKASTSAPLMDSEWLNVRNYGPNTLSEMNRWNDSEPSPQRKRDSYPLLSSGIDFILLLEDRMPRLMVNAMRV